MGPAMLPTFRGRPGSRRTQTRSMLRRQTSICVQCDIGVAQLRQDKTRDDPGRKGARGGIDSAIDAPCRSSAARKGPSRAPPLSKERWRASTEGASASNLVSGANVQALRYAFATNNQCSAFASRDLSPRAAKPYVSVAPSSPGIDMQGFLRCSRQPTTLHSPLLCCTSLCTNALRSSRATLAAQSVPEAAVLVALEEDPARGAVAAVTAAQKPPVPVAPAV